tara:strand:- start:46 stop:357 length:312 start_codon:yes stop_codon:yes gene_type:complete
MANITVVQAVDAIERKFPKMPSAGVVAVCNILDRSRTNSVESVVEEIERLMVLAGIQCNASSCDILSALAQKTLSSHSDDQNHVNGLDFGRALNEVMRPEHKK